MKRKIGMNTNKRVTRRRRSRNKATLICLDEKTAADAPGGREGGGHTISVVTASDGSGGPPRRHAFPGVLSTALRLLIKADTEQT